MVRSMSGRLILLVACSLASSCGARRDPAPAPEAESAPPAAAEAERAPSEFVAVVRPTDDALLEAPARALFGEGNVETIAATYPLRIVTVRLQAGDAVTAGAPIVEVSSAALLEAAASYRSAQDERGIVERRLVEVRALREQRVASTEQVFELERSSSALRSRERESLATLRGAGVGPGEISGLLSRGTIVLRARGAGVVRELDAVPGAVHPDGHVFATIVTGTSQRIEARFPSVPREGFAFSFEDLRGTIFPLGETPTGSLDAGENGGFIVWFDVPAGLSLPPGALGHVHATPTSEDIVEVPIGALRPVGTGAEVERRRGGQLASVAVTVLASSGTSAIVRGDLRTGDEVNSDAQAGATP